MPEVRCPECNETDIHVTATRVDRETGKPTYKLACYAAVGILLLIGLLFLQVGLVDFLDEDARGLSPLALGMAALFILPALVIVDQYIKVDEVTTRHHNCSACHHTWDEREAGGWSRFDCPHCHSDRVLAVVRERIDPEAGSAAGLKTVLYGTVLAAFGLLLFFGGLTLVSTGGVYAAIGALLVIGGAGMTISGFAMLKRFEEASFIRTLACQDCDHRWTMQENSKPELKPSH